MAFQIKLRNGETINAATFDRITRVDDSKLPSNRKTTASLNAYKKNFQVEPGTIDIPVAEFSEYKGYIAPSSKKQSDEYYVFVPKTKNDYDQLVEYDFDEEDSNWLRDTNKYRNSRKQDCISHEEFEFVMDRLEKKCSFEPKAEHTGNPDDVCCICSEGDTDNSNQIIYCDLCNVAVHQDCYGVPYIPSGQWLCRKCKICPSTPVECCLCPNTSGAFKQTSDGRWTHVVCAIWLNEVHFGNASFLEPVEGVDNCLRKRAKLKCIVCRQKVGACIQCTTRSCPKSFHVTCAQGAGMYMHIEISSDQSGEEVDVKRFVYCHLHSEEGDTSGDRTTRKKHMAKAIKLARANLNHPRVFNVNMPIILPDSVVEISSKVNCPVVDILQYWYLKRKSRCGAPLIRRLQTETKVPQRQNLELSSDEKKLLIKFNNIRVSWENQRLLCELVKKREQNKKIMNEINQRIADIYLELDSVTCMEAVLQHLMKEDREKIFHSPVKISGYRSIIKTPMDFATMQNQVADGTISTFPDLRSAFSLMLDNCAKYNSTYDGGKRFIDYGKKYKKTVMAALDQAERRYFEGETFSDLEKDFCSSDYYDSLKTEEPDDTDANETEAEGDKDKKRTRLHSSSTTCNEKKTSPPKKSRNLFGDLSTSTPKRKALVTHSSSRSKKIKTTCDAESNKITKYYQPQKTEAVVPAPLMAYRDNSAVKSPLPADAASSESSTEEDESQTIRRSSRLFESSKEVDSSVEDEVFQNADLVSVNGTAGRVVEPAAAVMDPDLPKELKAECRSRRRESRVCVIFFETENKWGWYLPSEIKHLKMGDNKAVTSASVANAKNWFNRILMSQ